MKKISLFPKKNFLHIMYEVIAPPPLPYIVHGDLTNYYIYLHQYYINLCMYKYISSSYQ